jgi:tellurite resistance protein TehA-like permease
MGAAWLLPITACVVAAASGSIVTEVIPHPEYALGTLVASYTLW